MKYIICGTEVIAIKIIRFICFHFMAIGIVATMQAQTPQDKEREIDFLIKLLKSADVNERKEGAVNLGIILPSSRTAYFPYYYPFPDPSFPPPLFRAGIIKSHGRETLFNLDLYSSLLRGEPSDKLEELVENADNIFHDGSVSKAAPDLLEYTKGKTDWQKVLAAAYFACFDPVNFELDDDEIKDVSDTMKTYISVLIEALDSKDEFVRMAAIGPLMVFPPNTSMVFPALVKAVSDPNNYVRRAAAVCLGKYGDFTIATLPSQLNDFRVDFFAERGSIEEVPPDAAPRYYGEKRSPQSDPSKTTITIPQNYKDRSISALIEALKDSDAEVRKLAIVALGKFGKDAKSAIPSIINGTTEKDESLRWAAVWALGNIGYGSRDVAKTLKESLGDKSEGVRLHAIWALSKIGPEAKIAIPDLIEALNYEKTDRPAAETLETLALTLNDAKEVDSREMLHAAYTRLQQHKDTVIKDRAPTVKRVADYLDSLWFNQILDWPKRHPWLALLLSIYPSMICAWLTLLWRKPLWLLRINQANLMASQIKLPVLFGGLSLSLRQVLLVSPFHYHPRVLDKWVEKHIALARNEFNVSPTVKDREVYVFLPEYTGEIKVSATIIDTVKSTFQKKQACLLVWGEGGAGKTSLACQIAKMCITENAEERLLLDRYMLPILIEQELELDGNKEFGSIFLKAIGSQLRALIDEREPLAEDFIIQLLRQQRLLVIIDGFSELGAPSQKTYLEGIKDVPVNAVIITSRINESLPYLSKTVIKPHRIRGNRLSTFMEAYLNLRGLRSRFEDDEFFESCRKLSLIVGDREITVLLAKLYAEQMIALKEEPHTIDLPDSIPDLMLCYLNDINRKLADSHFSDLIVHQTSKIVAWECLQQTLRPASAARDDVIKALGGEEKALSILRHLEQSLKIIQIYGSGRDQYKFSLDPLAEYLAALHLIDKYGQQSELWRKFILRVDALNGDLAGIKGFLLALRDCCATKSEDSNILAFIAQEINIRMADHLSAEIISLKSASECV